MRVAVIGAGVVGITTTYYLRQLGCAVSVFDKEPQAAAATSHANGGQLSYSYCDAMADPQLLRELPRILAGANSSFKFNFRFDPKLVNWIVRFLAQCTPARRDSNTITLLKLGARSAQLMSEFNQLFGSAFRHQRNGKLVVYNGAPDAETKRRTELKQALGLDVQLLNQQQMLAVEPSLSQWPQMPDYAVYASQDEVGDAQSFAQELTRRLSGDGVSFYFGNRVMALYSDLQTTVVSSVAAGEITVQEHEFDAVVVCTGDGAQTLLQPLGIRLPIYPVAGYSLTLERGSQTLACSITAAKQRLVFSPLAETIRVAGFADFNPSPNELTARTSRLLADAQSLAPELANYDQGDTQPWLGFRPMTPDSLPIVGATACPRIFLNTGHGMLGWTLCAGTAENVAQAVIGNG